MNKTELLDALNVKFHLVLTPTVRQDVTPTLKEYRVMVYDLIGDGIRGHHITFFVENEGLGTEAAFWAPSEPKPPAPPVTPQELLMDFLNGLITAGTVRSYEIKPGTLNLVTRSCVVNALLPALTWQSFLIEYIAGNFQYTPIP